MASVDLPLSSPRPVILSAEGLTKRFGQRVAVSDVSFDLAVPLVPPATGLATLVLLLVPPPVCPLAVITRMAPR